MKSQQSQPSGKNPELEIDVGGGQDVTHDETNFYSIPNVNYQALTVDPPTNSYFNSTTYYLPKKQF